MKQHSIAILGTESQDLIGRTRATTLQVSSRSSVTKPSSHGELGIIKILGVVPWSMAGTSQTWFGTQKNDVNTFPDVVATI